MLAVKQSPMPRDILDAALAILRGEGEAWFDFGLRLHTRPSSRGQTHDERRAEVDAFMVDAADAAQQRGQIEDMRALQAVTPMLLAESEMAEQGVATLSLLDFEEHFTLDRFVQMASASSLTETTRQRLIDEAMLLPGLAIQGDRIAPFPDQPTPARSRFTQIRMAFR